MNKYLGDWDCREDLENDFEIKLNEDINIIVACYVNYSGQAIVLFERNNKVYFVEGSHCSCYGLEGQWNEEEVNKEFINLKSSKGKWVYEYEKLNNEFIEIASKIYNNPKLLGDSK